ncbi:IS110 family transposase [Pseudomonas sp. BIC9C]|uniref:IS110 family transposase n=1 Tax=Pseudomonas sp. BIC9C TaxID=3078458 RepID=UPI002AD50392|nr:IS110 family transposase [Pseudomonas sp. BIC9C]
MNNVAIVAIDLGKHTFHLHAQDDRGHELLPQEIQSAQVWPGTWPTLKPCTVAMEACGGARYMARKRQNGAMCPNSLPPPRASLRESNKNDFADAMAICEASHRPTMRFVPPKTEAQQALAMLTPQRDAYIKERTASVNRIHAGLLEVGISLSPGFHAIKELPALLEACSFSAQIKQILLGLREHFNYLDGQVKALDKQVERQAAEDDLASRLMTIPCVGPITSSVLAAELGNGQQFSAVETIQPRLVGAQATLHRRQDGTFGDQQTR